MSDRETLLKQEIDELFSEWKNENTVRAEELVRLYEDDDRWFAEEFFTSVSE